MLDSHTRSLTGFQSLIQKEWIALGHPFCKRLGHLRSNESEQVKSYFVLIQSTLTNNLYTFNFFDFSHLYFCYSLIAYGS